jgi:hypothetical protein
MSFLEALFPKASTPAPVTPAPAAASPSPTAPIEPAAPNTPLDPYGKLWENEPTDLVAPAGMDFNVTPQQLSEIAGKIDFASVVPAAIHQRIAAGGDDAVAASMEMQNLIARAVYSQNAMATTKLVEAATQKAQEGLESIIDRRLKLMGVAENTATLNPALSNPAVAPLVSVIQQRFVQKFPSATSAEINTKVNEYFSQVGAAFNPDMAAKANAPRGTSQDMKSLQPETDWASFLS